jgi:tetratricopeptide (TPR) repeat protein
MHKLKLLSLILLLTSLASAQKVSMKKWMLPDDHAELGRQAVECMAFDANMQISFNSFDLYTYENITPDKPASLESIKELEKSLKGDASDAIIFGSIAGVYKRLKMQEEAEASRQKAIYLLTKVVEEHPDSVQAIFSLSGVYLSGGQFEESISLLRKTLVIKPDYQDPNVAITMMYLFSGQFDSIYPFLLERTGKYPELYSSYVPAPIYYFYNMYRNINLLEKDQIQRLNTDSVMAMDLLTSYYERNKKDYDREYLYRASYQTTLAAYLVFRAITRPDFDNDNIYFGITGPDKERLLESEKFFLSSLKKKEVENKYLSYKILGSTYLLLDQPKKAIPYIKKAIELRPVNKSNTMMNADEAYENLIACHFILKDTTACEKVLLEKIKVNPAIDPNSLDYQHLGNLYMSRHQFAEAEKMYTKAIDLNYGNAEAMMGLAVLQFRKSNKKGANDYIKRAYAADKNTWQIYYLSALMALEDNDAKNAYEFYQITKKMNDRVWLDEEIEKYFEVK